MGLLTDDTTVYLYRVTCSYCGVSGWNDEEWTVRHSLANAKYSGIFHKECAWASTMDMEKENKEYYARKRGERS